MRTHPFKRHSVPEMLALGLVELLLTFALMLVLLTPVSGRVNGTSVQSALLSAATVGFVAFCIGLYRPQIFSQARGLLFNTFLSAVLSFPAVWMISKTFDLGDYWPVGYDSFRPIKIIAIWSMGVMSIRLAFLSAMRCGLFVHRVAVIETDGTTGMRAFPRAGRNGFLEIEAFHLEDVSVATLKSGRFRTLVLPDFVEPAISAQVTENYRQNGIALQSQAQFSEQVLRRIDIETIGSSFSAGINEKQVTYLSSWSSRVFDICTSLALLITTLPLMALVGLLIKLDSRGPILYRQERVGLQSRPFTLLKFRSMRSDAEASGPKWAQQRDPRVTRIGSFMRKTRIDELPQLINILRGEMSFIGPRPERPHFVEQLAEVIPSYHERARVKPGLTGWAQVNFPYGASVEDARMKLSYDLYYVKNRSFLLDLLIMVSTVRVILLQEGAR